MYKTVYKDFIWLFAERSVCFWCVWGGIMIFCQNWYFRIWCLTQISLHPLQVKDVCWNCHSWSTLVLRLPAAWPTWSHRTTSTVTWRHATSWSGRTTTWKLPTLGWPESSRWRQGQATSSPVFFLSTSLVCSVSGVFSPLYTAAEMPGWRKRFSMQIWDSSCKSAGLCIKAQELCDSLNGYPRLPAPDIVLIASVDVEQH